MGLIFYFFKEAIRGLYQAKLMTFVSIISVAASLFFMSIVVLGFVNIESVLEKTDEQADIAVYLEDDVSQDSSELNEIMRVVKGYSQVERAEVINKDSAWERFESLYGSEMLYAVDDNPLPASIEIYIGSRFRSSQAVSSLCRDLEQIGGVESVRYSREWMELVEKFRWFFYLIAGIAAFIMMFVLHFMISSTIKLTIYARKELVQNMHMVGATAFFIKMPFLLEGMLQGLIGGIIGVFFLNIFKVVLSGFTLSWGPDYFPLVTMFLGVFFGWIGSLSAVRKFLA